MMKMYKLIQKAISTVLIFCMLPTSGFANPDHGKNDDPYICAFYNTSLSYSEAGRKELPRTHPFFLPDNAHFFGSELPCLDPNSTTSRESQHVTTPENLDDLAPEHINLPPKSHPCWNDFILSLTSPFLNFYHACVDQLLRIFWDSSSTEQTDHTRDHKTYAAYFSQAFNQIAQLTEGLADELHEYVAGALIVTVLKIGVFSVAPYLGLTHTIVSYIAISCAYSVFSSLLYGFDFLDFKFDGILSHVSDFIGYFGVDVRLEWSQKKFIEEMLINLGIDESSTFSYFINTESLSFAVTVIMSFFMMRFIPVEEGTRFATLAKGFLFLVFSKELLANLMYFLGRMISRLFTYDASDKSIGYLFMRLFKLGKASSKALKIRMYNEYHVVSHEKQLITDATLGMKRNTELWLSLHNSAKVTQEPLKMYQAICGTVYLFSESFFNYNHTAEKSSFYQFCSKKYDSNISLLIALTKEYGPYLLLGMSFLVNFLLFKYRSQSTCKRLSGPQIAAK